MNNTSRVIALVGVCAVLLVAFFAWQHEGPAEQTGASIDNAAQSVKDAIDPPGPMEKAGRSIDKAIK